MEYLWQDIRHGIRTLLNKPGFTAVALLVLMLGIGSNIALFNVINAIILRPLPFKEPDRIMMVWGKNPRLNLSQTEFPTSYLDFLDWQKQNRAFDYISAFQANSVNLAEGSEPERVGGVGVTSDFFKVLGIEAARGRTFLPEEDISGNQTVVVLSHNFWQRRFGSDPEVIGKSISLDGEKHTVVGIMPERFEFPRSSDLPAQFNFPVRVELWMPLKFSPFESQSRGNRVLTVMGRLRADVNPEQAQAEMTAIADLLEQQYPNTNSGYSVKVLPLYEEVVGDIKPTLFVLLGAVVFVLGVATANVANLMLAHTAARQREIAIRIAVGASRLRIIQRLLTESILLSLTGGAAGALMAMWATDLIIALSPAGIPRLVDAEFDYRMLIFAVAISILTGIFFGLIPAFHATRLNLNDALKQSGRGSTGSGQRSRSLLVIAEVAITLVLLVGAGLMIKTLLRLYEVDAGFKPDNLLTMQINLPLQKYTDGSQWSAFFEQAIDRVEKLPGVESACVTWQLPISGAAGGASFKIDGRPSDPDAKYSAGIRRVSTGYFQTMGIPLLRGRTLTYQDIQSSTRPIIINQAMAQQFFSGEDPIGKRIIFFGIPREIAGIVSNVKYTALDTEAFPEIYLSSPLWTAHLVVRSSSDPESMIAAVRDQILKIDKDMPVSNIAMMEQLVSESVAGRRFSMLLLNIFAAMALTLALIGIYGVMSYTVTQNTKEIGIRMALGAETRDVLKLVVGQGLALAVIGIGVGVAGAFALTRFMSALLFGVSPTDPFTFTGVAATLLFVAMLACYIPARRATKVDPIMALRQE